MQRRKETFSLEGRSLKEIKQRMLNWSQQFSILVFLDTNGYQLKHSRYECLLAAGNGGGVSSNGDALSFVQSLHNKQKDWLFGHICYDYKNVLEPGLSSSHPSTVGFPLLNFFTPQTVCYIETGSNSLTIESQEDPRNIFEQIISTSDEIKPVATKLSFHTTIPKDKYISTIQLLRDHIADGDCYEINFCNEGFCNYAGVTPLSVFHALNTLSPAPFAAYYRLDDTYMMCASPERYLQKTGDNVMSQPIKGTARRDSDSVVDEQIKDALKADIKERAENVMIVDLVRNDLARCCVTGSVQVEELFGIYSFPQVHQMISTVSGQLTADASFADAIRYSFPMGSMTGAPKYKVMQLIDKYEHSRRELFSGTVGYIDPNGDFDFNVVIRSLFYHAGRKYLSYQTGGAITYDSVPEKEWDEMRLKAWALERIFQ